MYVYVLMYVCINVCIYYIQICICMSANFDIETNTSDWVYCFGEVVSSLCSPPIYYYTQTPTHAQAHTHAHEHTHTHTRTHTDT